MKRKLDLYYTRKIIKEYEGEKKYIGGIKKGVSVYVIGGYTWTKFVFKEIESNKEKTYLIGSNEIMNNRRNGHSNESFSELIENMYKYCFNIQDYEYLINRRGIWY